MSIIFVTGSKGGTGKSFLSAAILDFLDQEDKNWFLIDTDTSNPDVYKAYCKESPQKGATINLDSRDGWIDLVNLIDLKKEEFIIINSAARLSQSIEEYSSILTEILGEINRTLVSAWVINRQRDSLQLLKRHIDTMPHHTTHVFRNLFFGNSEKYSLYNTSELRKTVEENGNTYDIPELADRVVDKIYSERKTIEQATSPGNPIGNRSELQRWRKAFYPSLFSFFSTLSSAKKSAPPKGKETSKRANTPKQKASPTDQKASPTDTNAIQAAAESQNNSDHVATDSRESHDRDDSLLISSFPDGSVSSEADKED